MIDEAEIKSLADLEAERKLLIEEKTVLSKQLAELGISGNRAYFARGTIGKDVWEHRTALAGRYADIEARLAVLKQELKQANKIESKDYIKEVIKETFGELFLSSVLRECRSRRKGNAPTKVMWEQSKSITFRKEFNDVCEMLISARNAINEYIRENEPSINKAEFLQKVSSLNKALPSVQEIERMRRITERKK